MSPEAKNPFRCHTPAGVRLVWDSRRQHVGTGANFYAGSQVGRRVTLDPLAAVLSFCAPRILVGLSGRGAWLGAGCRARASCCELWDLMTPSKRPQRRSRAPARRGSRQKDAERVNGGQQHTRRRWQHPTCQAGGKMDARAWGCHVFAHHATSH